MFFSRYGFARAVKQKTGEEVARAFESIFKESGRHPKFYLQTDESKEFFNKYMKAVAQKYKFHQFHIYDRDLKAGIAERFVAPFQK